MDKLQLLELLKSNKNKSGYYTRETTWRSVFPDHYKEISEWEFPDDFVFKQKVYHYLNNDKDLKLGLCPECGKRCGFYGVSV